ncbi:hypothetical protein ABEB36_006174 [Hypothenemus hampei]|uniref:PAS domain-containing protein n=1 Tax=Hypothenemus hampei TaxID=57062 RepID=A0ABD1ERT5_HYPHA
MPMRRGLVAPRTTLIETIIRKFDTDNRSFLVANYSKPGQCNIIYCSDGFCRLAGYSRAEVMQRSASCSFLCGPLTSQQAINGIREALQKGVEKHAEVLYYRKDDFSTIPGKQKKWQYCLSIVHFPFSNISLSLLIICIAIIIKKIVIEDDVPLAGYSNNNIKVPILAKVCDRYELSDKAAAATTTAVLQDVGVHMVFINDRK